VGAIVETDHPKLKAEPSQGSHFFHNITTLGINYITISHRDEDRIDWQWLQSLPPRTTTAHVTHVRLEGPMTLKVDGRTSRGVLFA
jgi:hypothetical protein